MITLQQACLESVMERIARIIARRHGITLSIRGGAAYIDMKTQEIVIPNIHEEEYKELKPYVDGLVDHEDGHAMHSSHEDMEPLKDDPVWHQMWNCLEDVWTEKATGAQYPGCHENIERLNKFMFKKVEAEWEGGQPFRKLTYAITRTVRDKDKSIPDFATDPAIGQLLPLLEPEILEAKTCTSTATAVQIARRILDKIKDLADQAPQPEESNGEGESGTGEPGDSKSGEGKESGEPGDEKSGEAEAGAGEDGDDLAKAKQQAKGVMDSLTAEDSHGEGDTHASGDLPLDVEDFFNREMHAVDRGDDVEPEHYVVFSNEYDYDTTYSLEERLKHTACYNATKALVQKYIGNMSAHLEMALVAETQSRFIPGARQGRKFDRQRLVRWFEGHDDDRIYMQLDAGRKIDTAVTLLWDCSGSMGGAHYDHNKKIYPSMTKSVLARISAVAFHEALTRVNIPHEVLGFHTGGGHSDELQKQIQAARHAGDDLWRYSRLEELDARMVFVPFGQSDGRAICEIGGHAANRDGECVLWAAKRLATRGETRKILIVGSDGLPAGARYSHLEAKYLKEVVQKVINAGIEVYGIGIKNKAVQHYYPDWVNLEDLSDLPTTVMRHLINSLLERKGHYSGLREN